MYRAFLPGITSKRKSVFACGPKRLFTRPETAHTLHISYICQKTATPKLGTGIKDGFEEMEQEFLFGTFHPEEQDYFVRDSVALGK